MTDRYQYRWVKAEAAELNPLGAKGWRIIPGTLVPNSNGSNDDYILMEQPLPADDNRGKPQAHPPQWLGATR